jgi:hypothetical protein
MTDNDLQGTWQFMSANLIGQMNGQNTTHTLQDDLESSLYVLIWMVLMYSETSDKSQVPSFLSGVLDPKPYGPTGGYGKADFLKARTFLQRVTFPGRPALHNLITKLAELFAVRYEEEPNKADKENAIFLLKQKSEASNPGDVDQFQNAYMRTPVYLYETRKNDLKGYQHTLDLIKEALKYPASWPTNDFAVKQDFQLEPPTPQLVIKSGWDTAVFVDHMDDLDDGDEDYEMKPTLEDL